LVTGNVKIAIASDHAGFALKDHLTDWLGEREGIEVTDLGPFSDESVDYPDFAFALCNEILSGKAERGILVCNSGIGMSIAANRRKGIRAALCLFPDMAWFARHHNNANVLVLGGGQTAHFLARRITEVFLEETFDGGRHERRTGKFDL
jgi:ribose 5-phosphate isomerase B